MKNIDEIKITKQSTIKDAMKIIDAGAVRFALVVDEQNHLLGTLTDGDVRRAILSGKSIDDCVDGVFKDNPTTVSVNATKEEIINICKTKQIYQVPVVDDHGKVVSVDLLDELLKPKAHLNRVVLMVGGLGTRLKPLTDNTPKPMLHVGGKPILQTIIEKFVGYGFTKITLCVNYKSEKIQEHFGDGREFGADIDYLFEDKRMGTAGALSLLGDMPTEPFFVMNGDLLTNVNFEHLLEFHVNNKAMATMCVREYDFQVPYGVVNIDDGQVKSIDEKPIHKFFVSAGIYMLNPQCISCIPDDEFYDMPTLFEHLIQSKENIISFPLREYWLDIGQMEEYEKANREYGDVFND